MTFYRMVFHVVFLADPQNLIQFVDSSLAYNNRKTQHSFFYEKLDM